MPTRGPKLLKSPRPVLGCATTEGSTGKLPPRPSLSSIFAEQLRDVFVERPDLQVVAHAQVERHAVASLQSSWIYAANVVVGMLA